MDLTANTDELAAAVSEVARLLPGRTPDPIRSGLLLTAHADGLTLAGNDHERAIRTGRAALVHTDGRVLVPARVLAGTLAEVAEPRVRLSVQGARLAVRTERGRFALPLLDDGAHPGIPEPPPEAGTVSGPRFAALLGTLAGTAGRDDALPLFTGIRLRAAGGTLTLVASDRFRMAVGTLPWPGADLDVNVPAALLGELAKSLAGTESVHLHADANRFALGWARSLVCTSVLDAGFLDESRVRTSTVDTTVELAADELAGAVRRVAHYTEARGVLRLTIGESELEVSGASQHAGEGQETVKASVSGGRTGPAYQARYLADALRAFAGQRVRMDIQPGNRATILTPADPDDTRLRYLIMPMTGA